MVLGVGALTITRITSHVEHRYRISHKLYSTPKFTLNLPTTIPTCPEGVAGRDGDLDVMLPEPVGNLGKVGGLAHTVHTTEDDNVRLAFLL